MTEVHNKIIVVDDKDNEIGVMDMMEARAAGHIRRASRVFVFNQAGQILVQRRSAEVLHPCLLDQSVGGHVDEGETYLEAAVREMTEELGISDVPLDEIVTSYRTEFHFNGIYRTVVGDSAEFTYNKDEVDEVIWFDPDDLTAHMEQNPDEFTSSFPVVWRELRDKIIP
ncbi:MAG: NUDIX domain-containing protein [Candidatus Kaiserbacteria bacterium]|nr:NUDIX domain-containing protein [Candidatus Kaiserbacteria bacterium]MCB9816072.1 NUDIX domain-containing protein [Candidatus Nomurabacteria bacterium]